MSQRNMPPLCQVKKKNSGSLAFRMIGAVIVVTCVAITGVLDNVFSTGTTSNTSWHFMRSSALDSEDEYRIFDNACLEAKGSEPNAWTIRVPKTSVSAHDQPLADQERSFEYRIFLGEKGFVMDKYEVIQDDELFKITTHGADSSRTRAGTYMLMANTHANNYHIINDILLPTFRAFQKTFITGLLVPEGCVECWNQRLSIQKMGFDMMNLTVVYPMEHYITNTTPMCFDRLIIQRFSEMPYYWRIGRFSQVWPHSLFLDFRESVHEYIRTLRKSDIDIGRSQSEPNTTNLAIQNDTTSERRPLLSWMSRKPSDKCDGRCITNKEAAVEQLSKYFEVKMLDFSTGLTNEQALSYIMKTDVLVGLHGAGLAYIAFLPDQAMVVELRGEYSNRMFINMASSVDVPCYAVSLVGCIGPGENNVYTLPADTVESMATEIYDAYNLETLKFSQGQSISSGECEFPQPVEPCGHLSSSDQARCYLHLRDSTWWQCSWHDRC